MLEFLFSSKRSTKRIITLITDSILITFSFWLAILLRFEDVSYLSQTSYWLSLAMLVPLTIFAMIKFGLYRAILRYIGMQAIWSIITSAALSTIILVLIDFFNKAELARSIPIIYFAIFVFSVGGSRLVLRTLYLNKFNTGRENILIYGAGSAGMQLAIGLDNGKEYNCVGFIDDDPAKQRKTIQGLMVYSVDDARLVIRRKSVKKILLALPGETRSRRKAILETLEKYPVQVQTIPGIADVIEGRAKYSDLQDVDIEDLLGRDQVAPNYKLMQSNILGKVVMVTGAGGSIGSELCRQIIHLQPKHLILFELSEYALYAIDKELRGLIAEKNLDTELSPMIGSVQRINRVETVMKAFGVQTVYHAAAYKHVPLVENNTVEGVRNNIFGSMYAAQAAIKCQVETFVLVSTDKAVRPTNVMGATKRMAELVMQALAQQSHNTRICMVRFGNVLGSSGSVVPLFREQIKQGGPVTLTHNDITRYFMTIPEAAQLVIQAGAMGQGGDVFVLDMGEPVRIRDLAKRMINLSGLELKDAANPHGDIEIVTTGLRPGEKLYEELLIGDNVQPTGHPRIMTANEVMLEWDKLLLILEKMDFACHNFQHELIRELLLKAPTAFQPNDPINDLVYLANFEKDAEVLLDDAKVINMDKKLS